MKKQSLLLFFLLLLTAAGARAGIVRTVVLGSDVASAEDIKDDGLYVLYSSYANFYVTEANNALAAGENLAVSLESVFKIQKQADGTYRLQANESGNYIAAATHNTSQGLTADEAQAGSVSFTFTTSGKVQPQTDGLYWDRSGGMVHSWNSQKTDESKAQFFTIKEVTIEESFSYQTTTVTDGAFAAGTVWYTLQSGEDGLYVSDNGTADRISLTTNETKLADADLWCFVGDGVNGFRLYNKAAGAGKVLAASADAAYPTLQDAGNLPDGYSDLWDIVASDVEHSDGTIGEYFRLHGTQKTLANVGESGELTLAEGATDANATVAVRFAKATFAVTTETGTFTSSNSSKTYHATWTSSSTPQFTLGVGLNNMTTSGTNIVAWVGSGSTYTLTAPANHIVSGYSFDYVKESDYSESVTLTVDGASYTPTMEDQHIDYSGDSRTATFGLTGGNKGIVLKNFFVTIQRSLVPPEPQTEIFTTKTAADINNRIPCIAKAYNGDVIVVADYRYSNADIGLVNNGKIDLRGRISKDNGATWGDIFTIARAQGADSPDSLHVAFGDPCIVADSESPRVLLMSCSGNVSFPSGTRTNHQGIARFYSEDNGATWGEPEDISESIYSQFDKSVNHGPVRAMFIGSGKICQSKTTKVGDYYRLYCAVLLKNASSVNTNFVIYSDDFGGSWKVLGGVETAPIPSGGDEPKAEELPDGSVVISSRTTGGRYYNIYSFTNTATGEGFWSTSAFSGASNNGTTAASNSTNGEIYILPVTRKSDNTNLFLALQSVPLGPGRANVGIYYKELEGLSDFDSPVNFAKDWDGHHQASYVGSVYSTMILQADNTLGFVYEEETYPAAAPKLTIIYKNYSIEQITDSAYTYNAAGIDRDAFVQPGVTAKVEEFISTCVGSNVGNITAASGEAINAAAAAYAAAPSKANYEAINAAIVAAERVKLENAHIYRLRNYGRMNGTLYLKATSEKLAVATLDEQNNDQLFSFIENEDGTWKIFNESQGVYVGATGADYNAIPVVTTVDDAVAYNVSSTDEGLSALICTAPTGSHDAIHLSGDNATLVPWSAGSPSANSASFWYIEPTDMVLTGVEGVTAEPAVKEVKFYDLQGRRVMQPAKGGIYVTGDRRKVFVK